MANGIHRFRLLPALGALLIAPLAIPARASTNLLNVYIGAGVGHASLRAKDPGLIALDPNSLGSFDRNDTAYQFMAGVRGLYMLGAEVDYFHLGSGGASPYWSGIGAIGNAHISQKGEAAFALLYLPIPAPFIDVYLKAGVARITSDLDASLSPQATCAISGCTPISYAHSVTSTGFAAGAGVQWSLGNWAVRGEYERFTVLGEHPDLLSVGVTWSLL